MEVNLTENVEAATIAVGWLQELRSVSMPDITLSELAQQRHRIDKIVSYKFRTSDGTEFDELGLAVDYLKRREITNYILHCEALRDYTESEKLKLADVISNLDIQGLADALAEAKARCNLE